MAQSSRVTKTIVKTVADYENASTDDLSPLADKLDTETFHRLTTVKAELTEPLTFEYLWYDVTVHPDGGVIVTP